MTGRAPPVILAAVLGLSNAGANNRTADHAIVRTAPAVLWRDPGDIGARSLYYGPGGKEHEPRGPFIFEHEDLKGGSPKFVVRERDGVKWKVKLGLEARPETAATRLVWAVGYFTSEDYLVTVLRVDGMPPRLKRGQKLISPDGSMINARLKREARKAENWHWRRNSFAGTRELNGLRAIMAVINSWDLTDENNGVYMEEPERVFMVTDLGSSFGTTGWRWPMMKAKGNLAEFKRSRFIRRVTPDYVDFATPAPPWIFLAFDLPSYLRLSKLHWIGRHVPRADAQWAGQLLARLSPDQIRDAFRAAGYGAGEVEGFAKVIERRIALRTL